jgi:hypothetical protein
MPDGMSRGHCVASVDQHTLQRSDASNNTGPGTSPHDDAGRLAAAPWTES